MSFEDLGRALDNFAEHALVGVSETMRSLSRAVQLAFAPHPTAEGRRLTEDLSCEDYDLVERSNVRVERVPAETHDGEAATVRYHDGGEWSDVTRYDLDAIAVPREDR